MVMFVEGKQYLVLNFTHPVILKNGNLLGFKPLYLLQAIKGVRSFPPSEDDVLDLVLQGRDVVVQILEVDLALGARGEADDAHVCGVWPHVQLGHEVRDEVQLLFVVRLLDAA